MKLSDLFQMLSTGELNQLNVGNTGNGIRAKDYPKVITQINLGLTDLHSRFPLREGQVTIQMYEHISHYYLRRQFAQTNQDSQEKYKYIEDSQFYPFQENVIRVERVTNEVGHELQLNNDAMCCELFTPSFDCIQVIRPIETNTLFVTYRANHDWIPTDTTDPTTVEVVLPASHVKALCYFVAAAFYSMMPSDGATQKGVEWNVKYEAECSKIEELDLDNASLNSINVKPCLRGWV